MRKVNHSAEIKIESSSFSYTNSWTENKDKIRELVFKDNISRMKYLGSDYNTGRIWWLRTANTLQNGKFYYVNSNGSGGSDFSQRSYYIALGFCLGPSQSQS